MSQSTNVFYSLIATNNLAAGIPFDLGDPCSARLAGEMVGIHGSGSMLSHDMIGEALPEDWLWTPDSKGGIKHTYLNVQTGLETTVHPSYFWREDDKDLSILPPGWDRRLDSWGNLFFVDHNTQAAFREDPRFSAKIDQETGLPKGWHCIDDVKNKKFFFQTTGKFVIGTYDASKMNSKSLKGKRFLTRAPKDGEKPASLLAPGQRHDEKVTTDPSTTLPPMTGAEKDAYEDVFTSGAKLRGSKITFEEALLQCKAFALPEDEIQEILHRNDANNDGLWNVDEYSDVLHQIKARVSEATGDEFATPMDEEEKRSYYSLFRSSKGPEEEVMTREGIESACKDLDVQADLPPDFVARIIDNADRNRDQRWNVDEFAEVVHRIMQEVRRREALRMISPRVDRSPSLTSDPVPDTPTTEQITPDQTSYEATPECLQAQVFGASLENGSNPLSTTQPMAFGSPTTASVQAASVLPEFPPNVSEPASSSKEDSLQGGLGNTSSIDGGVQKLELEVF